MGQAGTRPENLPGPDTDLPGPPVAGIVELFLKVLAGMSLLVALTAAVLGPARTVVAATANGVLNLALLWRVRRGHSEGAAFLSALGLLITSLHAIARGSGIHDIGMVVVAVLMMVSALLERRWQALVIAGGAAIGVWIVGAAEVSGRFPFDDDVPPAWDDVVVVTILLVGAAILMRVVVSRLRSGILELDRGRERRRQLEEELRHAERLRALGQLASSVAHDFNNELTGILAGADFLRRALPVGDPGRQHADDIAAAVHRSADLTRQLLATARRAQPRQDPLDLADLVEKAVGLLRRTLPPAIEVRADISPGSFRLLGDASLLHGALLNLGVNARDAMPAGGRLEFRLRRIVLGAAEAQPLDLRPGAFLEISVSDTGTGIEPATLGQIFDPFFTTKQSGTGLGLAAVYGTLRAHGGAVTASSTPGEGSCFRLLLPHLEPPAASLKVRRADRSLSVLVVDGDERIRESTARVLTSLGHKPTVSAPGEVPAVMRRLGGQLQLVIVDRDAADAAQGELRAAIRGEVPFVVLSKPFGRQEVADAIASVESGT